MVQWFSENNAYRKALFFVIFLFSFLRFGYTQHDFKGKVVNSITQEPIPYVNIGIVEAGIGTVSDEQGLFHLPLAIEILNPKTKVLFSSLGYESLNIPISEIPLVYNKYPNIKMRPATIILNEVVVTNKVEQFITDFVGYRNYAERAYGYWKDNIALGGELATLILAKNGKRKLEMFTTEVKYNPSDSLLLRINVYDDNGPGGKPGENLNKSGKNILYILRKDLKTIKVDLSPYEIYVNGDFLISLELLRVYGKDTLELVLFASDFGNYGSFRRYASQGKWEKIDNRNMAYRLETSLLVSEKVAQRYKKRKAKKEKKQQTVSGFAIHQGRMIANVRVTNNRSKHEVLTDQNGRYRIPIDDGDVLTFSKEGYTPVNLRIGERPTLNVIMKPIQ